MNQIIGEQKREFEISKRKLALIDRIIKKNQDEQFFRSLRKKAILSRYCLVMIQCGEKDIFEISKQIEKQFLLNPQVSFEFFGAAYLSLRGKINFLRDQVESICAKFRKIQGKFIYLGEILIKRKNFFKIKTWKEHEAYIDFQNNILKLLQMNKTSFKEIQINECKTEWLGQGNEKFQFQVTTTSTGDQQEDQKNTILFGSLQEHQAVNFFSFLSIFSKTNTQQIQETIYTEEQIKAQQNFEQKRVFYLSSSQNYLLNVMIKDEINGGGGVVGENTNLKIQTNHLFQQEAQDEEEQDYFDYGYKNLQFLASFQMTSNLNEKQQTDLLQEIEEEDKEFSKIEEGNVYVGRQTIAITDFKKTINDDHLKVRQNILAEIDEIQNEDQIHHQLIENDQVQILDQNLENLSPSAKQKYVQNELLKDQQPFEDLKHNEETQNGVDDNISDDSEKQKGKAGSNEQSSQLFQSILQINHHHQNQIITDTNQQSIFPFTYLIHSQSQAGQNLRGDSKTNQDSFIVIDNFANSKSRKFMGVFDGHGQQGHKISQYVKTALTSNISRLLETPLQNQDKYFSETISKLQEAFLQTQKEILELGNDGMISGTTAICVYMDGKNIFCMNLGDSKAIIVQEIKPNDEIFLEKDDKTESKWEVKPISKEQRANNFFQYLRIISSGGRVMQDQNHQGPFRVCHPEHGFGLCMSRSLGDGVLGSVGVISLPEIFCHQITVDDRFLVVASDGLWEFLINNQVVSYIIEFYRNKDPQGASQQLWLLQEQRSDDISIILMFFYHDATISASNQDNDK